MNTLSYSELRGHLASALDRVNEDRAPILITRRNGKPAVLMSVDDFRSYEETAYLMASPKNAKRLNRAITAVETGNTNPHALIEE